MASKKTDKTDNTSTEVAIIPKYLRLAKGAMWLDDISGISLYAINHEFVGRGTIENHKDRAVDKYNNQNQMDYGFKDSDLPWYIDTTSISSDKLSRIIHAHKLGILIECDPSVPLINKSEENQKKNLKYKNGDIVFSGKNSMIYQKLQNLTFDKIKDFIINSPLTSEARSNLMDMLDYEQRGFNPISRPRLEVLDLLKKKLNDYGPGMSAIRTNDED